MKTALALLLTFAAPAAAKNPTGDLKPELGWRAGAAMGAGSAGRYGASAHLGLYFAVPVNEFLLFGMDASGNPNHTRRGETVPSNSALYDSRINAAQVGGILVYVHQISDYLDLRPSLGLSFYQVNSFEKCANPSAACDRASSEHVSTDNYFGVNYGIQLAFKLGKDLLVGPEARMHQTLGGGRLMSPAFFTPAFFMNHRF